MLNSPLFGVHSGWKRKHIFIEKKFTECCVLQRYIQIYSTQLSCTAVTLRVCCEVNPEHCCFVSPSIEAVVHVQCLHGSLSMRVSCWTFCHRCPAPPSNSRVAPSLAHRRTSRGTKMASNYRKTSRSCYRKWRQQIAAATNVTCAIAPEALTARMTSSSTVSSAGSAAVRVWKIDSCHQNVVVPVLNGRVYC